MRLVAITLLTLLATACNSEGGNQTTADNTCSAKVAWSGGDHGSSEMRPGGDCIGCHKSRGEGPNYVVAGTIYGDIADHDNCEGKSAITVQITGADGKVTSVTSNAAGNFSLSNSKGSVKFPYTVQLLYNGKKYGAMATKVSDGSCNTCHTATGKTEGPAGRIIAFEE
jgi:mono/diheme cytochrome c family protein